MRRIIKFSASLFCASLLACTVSGPQKALDEMADALQGNNPSAFIDGLDMKAYAANYLASMTTNDGALSSLNSLSNIIGLGGLDQLINNVVDYQTILRKDLVRGVASGELMEKCKSPQQINCPWVPQSLRDAQITEIGQSAAIAKVTTPANLVSWIALRKVGEKWLVVGQALLEQTAREYAAGDVEPPSSKI